MKTANIWKWGLALLTLAALSLFVLPSILKAPAPEQAGWRLTATSAAETEVARPTIFYVDGSNSAAGDDEQHGSIGEPWQSIAYAFSKLRPGDTLLIRAGIYDFDGIHLQEENSGTQEAPIRIRNFVDEEVVIQGGSPLSFQGASWWILEGLHFRGFPGIQIGLHTNLEHERTSLSGHITFRDCEFADGSQSSITINNGGHIRVEGCTFRNVRPGEPFTRVGEENNAVVLRYRAEDIVITRNRFEDIGSDGVHIGSQSYLEGAEIGAVEVTENVFLVQRPYQGPLGNVGENGVDVKSCRGPILISENVFHGFRPTTPGQDASGANGDGLIIHDEARNVLVERNLFFDNTSHLNIAMGDGHGPADITIRSNIFRDTSPSWNSGVLLTGFGLQVRSATNVRVYNNTFLNNRTALVSVDVRASEFKNNVVIGGNIDLQEESSDWEVDHNAWSRIEGEIPTLLMSEHDVQSDDLGLDRQLRPEPDSPLLDAGMQVGVSLDFYGRPRQGPPDIGAIEAAEY